MSDEQPRAIYVRQSVECLKRIARNIQEETRPIKGHNDKGAILDCWNEIFDISDALFAPDEVKRMLFRVSELTVMYTKNNPTHVAPLHINYEQVMANKGLVVDKPTDH